VGGRRVSWAIWITGVPGSGKSAIARAAAAELSTGGHRVQVLELDALRRTLTPEPTYDDTEREAVYRALVMIARTLTRAGRPVIIDATAHRRAWRDLARASIGDFAEVQLVCPLDVARARERTRGPGHHPRAIYERAGQPGATVPGVNIPYEPAITPELTIDTTVESVESAAARVAALGRTFARRSCDPSRGEAWTLWVTGRPGSGKTTVVSSVGERLRVSGRPLMILEAAAFSTFIAPEGCVAPKCRAIVAGAIVLSAKLLSDAGIAVIIDGVSPVRGGHQLARDVLTRFAVVELACPPDISRARERAVRWNLVPCPAVVTSGAIPDLGLDYEPPVAPDLTLCTDVLDERTTTEEIVRLVDRLERAALERSRPCA
jgi:adenylylsulfate kinase